MFTSKLCDPNLTSLFIMKLVDHSDLHSAGKSGSDVPGTLHEVVGFVEMMEKHIKMLVSCREPIVNHGGQ